MKNNQDIDWMKIALKYAYYAKRKGEIPIGAILVLNERIIGTGWNCSISTNDPTAHAEIIALRKAGNKINNYRLINSTLYVTLQPCMMCCGAIIHSRIKKLVFGSNYNKSNHKKKFLGNILLNLQYQHKLVIKKNIMQYECSAILTNFFKRKRIKEIL